MEPVETMGRIRAFNIAQQNISKYLNRVGTSQGDVSELYTTINDRKLKSRIGYAMGFKPADISESILRPTNISNSSGYSDDAIKVINHIIKQLFKNYGKDQFTYVTILPVNIYFNGKLHEKPLFRVSRNKNSKSYFVDNIGRIYKDFNNWKNTNKLPPGIMYYPINGCLQPSPNKQDVALIGFCNTPAKRYMLVNLLDISAAISLIKYGSNVTEIQVVLASALAGTYGTVRSVYDIYDRAAHDESINPFTNFKATKIWLRLGASVSALGVRNPHFEFATDLRFSYIYCALVIGLNSVLLAARPFDNLAQITDTISKTEIKPNEFSYFLK